MGIEGVGKRTAAMAFAMACNCVAQDADHLFKGTKTQAENVHTTLGQITTTGPCGCCRSCRKIQSGSHPDIILVKPSGPFIRIGQIRDLCHILSMKPYEARVRVVIISNAQAMNPAASNALLKVLEEPPNRTILILTAMQTSDLLPTVVSRCQHIRFNPISQKNLEALLMEKQGVDPDDAKTISIMANGSYSKAISMTSSMNHLNWRDQRNWLINEVEFLSTKPIVSLMAFAAKLSKNKEVLADSLEVIKSWLRDLVICKYQPEKIVNIDLADKVKRSSKKLKTTSLLSKIHDIQSAQKNIQANANLRLTLEVLIMRLARD
jgi:DNA polymerase-3 subunit delta'